MLDLLLESEVVLGGGCMGKYFSVESAECGVVSALQAIDEHGDAGLSIVEALEINKVVKHWVLGQPDVANGIIKHIKIATAGNISMLGGLWALCAKHGVNLTTEQKVSLFQNFLDN